MSCRRDDRVKKARGSKPGTSCVVICMSCRCVEPIPIRTSTALVCIVWQGALVATLILRRSYQSRSHVIVGRTCSAVWSARWWVLAFWRQNLQKSIVENFRLDTVGMMCIMIRRCHEESMRRIWGLSYLWVKFPWKSESSRSSMMVDVPPKLQARERQLVLRYQ